MRDRSSEARSSLTAARFGKDLRLRKRREFLTVQRGGRRRHTPHFVAITRDRCDEADARLGIAVSRAVGNAVTRNRIKRRVRELFRRARHRLRRGTDLVVIAKTGAGALSSEETSRELAGAWPSP